MGLEGHLRVVSLCLVVVDLAAGRLLAYPRAHSQPQISQPLVSDIMLQVPLVSDDSVQEFVAVALPVPVAAVFVAETLAASLAEAFVVCPLALSVIEVFVALSVIEVFVMFVVLPLSVIEVFVVLPLSVIEVFVVLPLSVIEAFVVFPLALSVIEVFAVWPLSVVFVPLADVLVPLSVIVVSAPLPDVFEVSRLAQMAARLVLASGVAAVTPSDLKRRSGTNISSKGRLCISSWVDFDYSSGTYCDAMRLHLH